jgi:integrase/recombinase XerD
MQQKQNVSLITTKTNDEIINEYFNTMQTEINPSINYKRINKNTLNRLSRFHENKPFIKMKREDVLTYLNSLRKSEDIDPLHEWMGTYNLQIGNLIRFFKWLYNPTLEPGQRPKPKLLNK